MLIKSFGSSETAAQAVSWVGFFSNMVPVILGNLLGGSVLVGLVYQVIYRRSPQ